jgi:diadenylate cyclase
VSQSVAQLVVQIQRFPLLDLYLRRLRGAVLEVPWQAAIELLLIGVVVYSTLRFLRGTRGARLMQAVLLILVTLLGTAILARILGLDRILVLYPYFVWGLFFIALLVFQPELRRGLLRIGETFGRRTLSAESARTIDPVVQAAASLSRRKIGALIAFERAIPVVAVMETGIRLDAEASPELLETIFWPGSALHDLGVIVSHGRVAAAGCEFPLAEIEPAEGLLGSRHRAALGMSLETDALVVVVSEETGAISVATRGRLRRSLNPDQLHSLMVAELLQAEGRSRRRRRSDQAAPTATAAVDSLESILVGGRRVPGPSRDATAPADPGE